MCLKLPLGTLEALAITSGLNGASREKLYENNASELYKSGESGEISFQIPTIRSCFEILELKKP